MPDVKISELPAAGSVAETDLVPIVTDPGGSPETERTTVAGLVGAGTPANHASRHANGGADPVTLDAGQIASGTISDSRIPAGVTRDTEAANWIAYSVPRTNHTRLFGPPGGAPVQLDEAVEYAQLVWFNATANNYIGIYVSTAGSAGAVVRLGLRAVSNGEVGALLNDFGTVAATSTGLKTIQSSNWTTTTTGGWYALTTTVQGGATTRPHLASLSTPQAMFSGTQGQVAADPIAVLKTQTGVTGALPDTWTDGPVSALPIPRISVRFA